MFERLAISLLVVALVQAPVMAQTTVPSVPPNADESDDWWVVGYVADYSSVVVSLGLLLGLRAVDPALAAMGPKFDENDWEGILDPTLSDQIGRVHRPDTIKEWGLGAMAGVGLLGIVVMEWIPGANGLEETDWRLAHDSLLGYVEALAWTLVATEALKVGMGRLRPDFQDRAMRYHCGNLGQTTGACVGFTGEPLPGGAAKAEDEYSRGRKSFVSGHASFSFAMATYWSMVLGGRLVWGKRASATTMPIGILLQAGLMATAVFVTSSRVEDGRHHLSDVLTGALVGFGLAQVAYWRHFASDGMPHPRDSKNEVTVRIAPAAQGVGVGLTGKFF